MIRAVLFDALGTLFRMRNVGPEEALRAAVRETGADVGDVDAFVATFFAAPHRDAEGRLRFALEASDRSPEGAQKLADAFRLEEATALEKLPDVDACFDALSDDLRVGLLSNWSDGRSMRHALQRAGVYDRFGAVVTSGDAGVPKPDPRIFLQAVRLLDVAPEETLMVGDDLSNDLVPARMLGMRTAFVAHPRVARAMAMPGIDVALASLADLPGALDELDG